MAYRMQRQARPSLLRACAWRALQGAARTLPVPDVELVRLDLSLRHLPRRLDGLTVLHVTDLHLTGGDHPALALPSLLAGLAPDLTVYTGDMIEDDAGRAALPPLLQALRPRDAAFAVLGNHDHYQYRHATGEGPQQKNLGPLLHALETAGVQVLVNASTSLYDGDLQIVGLDDPALGRDRLPHAFAGVDPRAATLLLAHSPDVLVRLGDYRPGLLLAGHTHGGQLRLPYLGPIGRISVLPRRYAMGAYVYDGVQTYVSRGVGTSGAPARLYCPPEVTIITLRSPRAIFQVA
jgi:predicted MPP superfamily phosphohydrolase